MTRLGENVFKFDKHNSLTKFMWLMILIILDVLLLNGCFGVVFSGAWFLSIVLIPISFFIWRWSIRFIKCLFRDHTILDKEKGVVTVTKFNRWKGPIFSFRDIQMSEIMGVNQDYNITTTTKLVNPGTSNARWETTENRTNFIILH